MQKDKIRPDPEKVQYIIDSLSTGELLAQLAEEAAELGHAALKLRRAVDGSNPTPVTEREATRNLMEEIADVWLLIQMLELDQQSYVNAYRGAMKQKTDRWAARLDWGSEG